MAGAAPVAIQRTSTAAVFERRELPPTIHEVIRPIKKEIVQPVIFRDIDRLEIQQVKQPIFERDVRPLQVQQVENAPIAAPNQMFDMSMELRSNYNLLHMDQSRVEQMPDVLDVAGGQQPYMVETLHPKVIEEVKPVIHREVIIPSLLKVIQPYYEKIIEAPTMGVVRELPAIHREGVLTNPQVVWEEVRPGLRFQAPLVIDIDVTRAAARSA